MFARQIAVMKGQAWNVVETLKQADHGPLELTRRTRVCVWDDLVDVPVAIPMRVPSAEMRRQRNLKLGGPEEEEMDISAANPSSSQPLPQHDLLSLGSPTSELPNPNRFELASNGGNQSTADLGRIHEEASTTPLGDDSGLSFSSEVKQTNSVPARPPTGSRTKARVSFDERRKPAASATQHRRRYSFSTRHGSTAFMYDGDDLEGDLGYAAAEGMEGHEKKVIVERLETVKSKNPVFTWC